MKLISVNLGTPQPYEAKTGQSAINKQPATQPVWLRKNGVEGDHICDTKHHGGPDQAVYVYGQDDYDWWSAKLGRDLAPGVFGENLTVTGFDSHKTRIGDWLIIGEAVLEVTSPRIPCSVFAEHMKDRMFPKAFVAAERPGAYMRVLTEGAVRAGDAITWQAFDGPVVPLITMLTRPSPKQMSDETIATLLSVPIHSKTRADLTTELAHRASHNPGTMWGAN